MTGKDIRKSYVVFAICLLTLILVWLVSYLADYLVPGESARAAIYWIGYVLVMIAFFTIIAVSIFLIWKLIRGRK
jgi:hypothetical protein